MCTKLAVHITCAFAMPRRDVHSCPPPTVSAAGAPLHTEAVASNVRSFAEAQRDCVKIVAFASNSLLPFAPRTAMQNAGEWYCHSKVSHILPAQSSLPKNTVPRLTPLMNIRPLSACISMCNVTAHAWIKSLRSGYSPQTCTS